uniref:Uncharacterized protein n=1 Tax=Kalanchoe fedtschenkoi TaxID=63787 RepID=A0A7N0VBG9_KALFE
METTTVSSWHHNPLSKSLQPARHRSDWPLRRPAHLRVARAFHRSDFDSFARRVSSGEAWKDAWRTANEKFEYLVYEARKTAERIDREYKVSVKVNEAVRAAQDKAKEIDREYEIGQKWRAFALDFSRNWPRYRRELSDVVGSPLGRVLATVFFLWFALSGWLFRFLVIGVWVLPFAGPLLIGSLANSLVIKGECPACNRQFVGARTQIVRCAGCGNIVWQPTGDPFPRNSKGSSTSRSKQDVIDVEFEER